jgi:hypothetical protein
MFGIVNDALAIGFEIGNRMLDDAQVVFVGGLQNFFDVQVHVLPKMVQTGVFESSKALMLASSSGPPLTRQVEPKAVMRAFFHCISRARSKNSTSLGFEPASRLR